MTSMMLGDSILESLTPSVNTPLNRYNLLPLFKEAIFLDLRCSLFTLKKIEPNELANK
jgi:hypothetical protein